MSPGSDARADPPTRPISTVPERGRLAVAGGAAQAPEAGRAEPSGVGDEEPADDRAAPQTAEVAAGQRTAADNSGNEVADNAGTGNSAADNGAADSGAADNGAADNPGDAPAAHPGRAARPGGSRRTAESAAAQAALRRAKIDRLAAGARSAVSFWGRSLWLRVVVLTLVLSSIVMIGLGLVLQKQITDRLLDSKLEAAIGEARSARQTVIAQLESVDPNLTTLKAQLARARQALSRPTGEASSGAQGSAAGVFDAVIMTLPTSSVTAGRVEDVPAELRAHVAAGNLAWQYTTVYGGSVPVPALVVGTPAATSIESFGVYLIFPLTSEQQTVAVVQRTLLLGGAALALALTLIATLVASQVVRPVRRAAAVAERLAAGSLDERMPVKGAIELTTMARSFNGMAEAIRAQIRQLEEVGRLQRRFTSDVSHELRTPVTTVRMAADILHADRREFPPHLARATELLVGELDRFETLLADLLEISRYDAGMADLNAEPIDIRSHVTACVLAVLPLADKAGVHIDLQIPATPVVAEIDARRFERIVRNLLGNAVDHAEGAPVEVAVGSDEQAVAVSVTDHGVGLKPGEASLVFNRFWRADSSRQRQTGGTGLGLAISLEDARLHGGWLQASGSSGSGAQFRLTLPRKSGAILTGSPLPLRDTDWDQER